MRNTAVVLLSVCFFAAGCDEVPICKYESSELIPADELVLVDQDAADFVNWFVGDHDVSLTSQEGGLEERLAVLHVERLEDAPELWTGSCGESINVRYEISLEVPVEDDEAIVIVPAHRSWLPATWGTWSPRHPEGPSHGEIERLHALLGSFDLPGPASHYVDVELALPSGDGARCSGSLVAKARESSSREDQPLIEFRCIDE